MLKALIAKRTAQLPPRLHNLMRLAQLAGVNAKSEDALLLRELTAYYVQSRYPEEVEAMGAEVDRAMAQDTLARSEGIIEWLSSML